jgi:hypothetical protein
MRTERWYWLLAFCFMSLCIQLGMGVYSQRYHLGGFDLPKSPTIEVALEPLPEPKKPDPKPEPKKPDHKPIVKTIPKVTAPSRSVPVRHAVVKAEKPAPQPAPVAAKVDKQPILPRPDDSAAAAKAVEQMNQVEKPISTGLPTARKDAALRIVRNNTPRMPVGGGGSPAPSTLPGGHGGAPGPEAPPEDVVYNHGGAGGEKLPHIAPSIGGGKSSILAVEDNVLKNTLPEDKPGIGDGTGGGIGVGNGRGNGTKITSSMTFGTLRHKPGPGIGAAVGSGQGTVPPGGGRGTGAEQPGTGGSGLGYGRGKGIGLGDGAGEGVGNGPGTEERVGRMRGIPFGNIAGTLLGDPRGGGPGGNGPGGPGRGAVFGGRPTGGGGGPIHIVYALDISGSMRDGNKIGKAKEALKKALSELNKTDTFDIIVFKRDVEAFAPDSVPATLANVANGIAFVDNIQIGNGTNISRAMDAALSMNGITHIYLMSDGEPNGGIVDFYQLRQFVKEKNVNHVKILTLALGLGEQFPGILLLKGIAEDNDGKFQYINMARINNPN